MIRAQELVIMSMSILLLFGASKLPMLMRSIGTGELKKAKTESEKELSRLIK